MKNGGLYEKAAEPWEAFAVEDNRVITGQNPASGGAVAELVLQHAKITCKSRFSTTIGKPAFRNHLQNSNNFFSISESSIASIYSGLKS